MKKIFAIAALAGILTACNDTSSDTTATSDSTAASVDTAQAAPVDTTTAAAPMKDSVMTLKDGKVVIMVGGEWKPLEKSHTTTNGRKVSPDGQISKGGKKRKLEEGMMIDKDGQMTDKDGKMLDNTGWE